MGNYLDSMDAYTAFREMRRSPYFVDKSPLIDELIPRINTTEKYICITRPRRFGKSAAASMIAAFFSKSFDSKELFQELLITESPHFSLHLNQYRVIFISLNEMPRRCSSYERYIERIEKKLIQDLENAYPNAGIDRDDAVWDVLKTIYNADSRERFLFVLDEWDYIFHQDFVSEKDKKDYLIFLSNLLKGKPYVSLVYMTGILPITKYASGSELNMFLEYSMASEGLFDSYFGFTEKEVDVLYEKYRKRQPNPEITRESLRTWYDGYHTQSGERVYNPRSVVASLTNNNLGNYWSSSGPYDEIFYYIRNNVDAVRDALALMISGIPVRANVREYAATSMNLSTKDEILSAMVVYGFLSCENGYVRIPNKELMDRFDDMIRKESSLGYVFRLAKESEKMLQATLAGDTEEMERILELAHDTETPILAYNSEAELSAVINLVYLSARDFYRVEREEKAGKGFVDFIFYPETPTASDGIILELKVDHSPEYAIRQIKEKNYMLRFCKQLAQHSQIPQKILLVGIGYNKKSKKHRCKVEEWNGKIQTEG